MYIFKRVNSRISYMVSITKAVIDAVIVDVEAVIVAVVTVMVYWVTATMLVLRYEL